MAENCSMQRTIKEEVSLEGVGLHTGKKVKLTFKPAAANSGYVFRRTDLEGNPEIEADVSYVVNTRRGTNLEKKWSNDPDFGTRACRVCGTGDR